LVGRPEGKRPLGRPRHRWEDNIKQNLREIRIDGANWIRLDEDMVQWRAFVSTVMNLRVHKENRILFNKLSDRLSKNVLHHGISKYDSTKSHINFPFLVFFFKATEESNSFLYV
jgi:hypothetical protein